MQLQGLASDVTLHNAGRTSAFKMDANAKAFRVLSDTMYQNKIGSMVRETACNAYDSHVMAGCPDRPFQIHLPDAMEPHYSVRDFGLGLNDEGVRDVFTTYFRSTKDQNNNVVGAFGLGSKTPFAYTDAFTIVAILDGQKRQYSAFIDGEGLPSLTNLSETVDDNGVLVSDYDATDEGNGVEIIVPVTASDDFYRFRKELAAQLAFFTVKPEVLNAGDHEIDYMDWSAATDYMNCDNLLVGGRGAAFRGVWIVQGIVGYRMDVALVSGSLSEESKEFLNIIKESAILKFDLGQIEVTPSRETLSYSKYTLANIAALLDTARGQIKGIVQAQIDAIPDAYTKAKTLNENDALQALARVTKSTFESPGYYFAGGWHVNLGDIAAVLNGTYNAKPAPVAVDVDPDDEEFDAPVMTGLRFAQYTSETVRRRQRWSELYNARGHIKVNDRFVVLVRDTLDKPVVRQREFMSQYGSSTQMFTFTNRDGSPVTSAQLETAIATLGEGSRSAFRLASKVELPEPEARTNKGYKPPTAYSYDKGDDAFSARHWDRETCKLEEFEDGAYYTTVDRHSLKWSRDNRVLCLMADAGLLDRPIVAIREKDVARIENNPKWILADKMTASIIASVVNNRTMLNGYALKHTDKVEFDFLDDAVMEVLNKACAAGTIKPSSSLHKMARVNATLAKLKARVDTRGYSAIVDNIITSQRHNITLPSYDAALKKMKNEISKEIASEYPMLPFIRTDYFRKLGTVGEAVVAYVNSVTGA